MSPLRKQTELTRWVRRAPGTALPQAGRGAAAGQLRGAEDAWRGPPREREVAPLAALAPRTGRDAPRPRLAGPGAAERGPGRAGGEAEGLAPGLSAAGDAPRAGRSFPGRYGTAPAAGWRGRILSGGPGHLHTHPGTHTPHSPAAHGTGPGHAERGGGAAETYGRGPAPAACAIQTAPRCMLGPAAPRRATPRRGRQAQARGALWRPPRGRARRGGGGLTPRRGPGTAAGPPGDPLRAASSAGSEGAPWGGCTGAAAAPPQASSVLLAPRPAPALCCLACPRLTGAGRARLPVGKSNSSSPTSPPGVEPPRSRAGLSRPPRCPGSPVRPLPSVTGADPAGRGSSRREGKGQVTAQACGAAFQQLAGA